MHSVQSHVRPLQRCWCRCCIRETVVTLQNLRTCKRHAAKYGLADSAPETIRRTMLQQRPSPQVLHAPNPEAVLHVPEDQVLPRPQQPATLSHPCTVQECDWCPVPDDHEEFVDAEDSTDSEDDTGASLFRPGLAESDTESDTESDDDTDTAAAAGEDFDPSAKLTIVSWPPSDDHDDHDIALGWSMLQVSS